MAIIENGVGVLYKPIQSWVGAVAVPLQQDGGILSHPIFGTSGGFWFDNVYNAARALRFYIPSRLWTAGNDATDPGLTWGVHWMLGVVINNQAETSICGNSFRNGAQIQLSETLADGRLNPPPSIYYPTPGVPEWVSIQNASHLTVSLILGSTVSPQTPVCPLQLVLGQSWSS